MKTLDKLGKDLQKAVDSVTKDGSEALHSHNSFTCGFLFLIFLLLVPIAAIPFLPLSKDLILQAASQGQTGQLLFALAYSAMFLGFPVRALDVAIGLLYPTQQALAVVAVGRLLGLSLCYAFGQVCLKKSLSDYTAVRDSEKYYLAVYRFPWRFMWLIRLIYLPAGFQSYFCAACRVSYFSYLIPAFTIEMLTAAGQIYWTRGLSSLPDSLNFLLLTSHDIYFYAVLGGISAFAAVLLFIVGKYIAEGSEELKDLAK